MRDADLDWTQRTTLSAMGDRLRDVDERHTNPPARARHALMKRSLNSTAGVRSL
jgi:hypothetical protein